ncbi:MAG TPA: hypothetical protein DDZ83_18150 [Nitrospinae bacterium]|nr:hypothetical protein [Nitrospinota bacterium]
MFTALAGDSAGRGRAAPGGNRYAEFEWKNESQFLWGWSVSEYFGSLRVNFDLGFLGWWICPRGGLEVKPGAVR